MDFEAVEENVSTNGANRAGLWLSMAVSAALLFGMVGSVFYIGFKAQANGDALETLTKRMDKKDELSILIQDRLTKIEVSQNEIETQFCAQDIVRNLMHATDMRNLSILWEKQFGGPYPTNNSFYPTICNRRVK